MLFRINLPRDKREKMGNIGIHFLLSFSKVAILYCIIKTIPPNADPETKPYVYEIVIRDLIIYILNVRACLIRSYFSYCLTTLWLFLQIYDRISIIFVLTKASTTLKTLYGVVSIFRFVYNLSILIFHRGSRHINSFHEFGSNFRLYSKCNIVI